MVQSPCSPRLTQARHSLDQRQAAPAKAGADASGKCEGESKEANEVVLSAGCATGEAQASWLWISMREGRAFSALFSRTVSTPLWMLAWMLSRRTSSDRRKRRSNLP